MLHLSKCFLVYIINIANNKREFAKEAVIFKVQFHKWSSIMVLVGLQVHNPLVYIGTFIGSMLPDSDTPFSGIGKCLPLWKLAKDKYNVHRKITHSLFFAVCIGSISYIINSSFEIGMFIGVPTQSE